MKNIAVNFILFVLLSITFSALTACNGSVNSQKGPVDEPKTAETNTNTTTTNAEKKDDGYPPAPAAIAQAEFKMLDGSTFKLEDQKGKVILFNLWATWCGPCIAEMPHLNEMQEKYKDKGFEVVGLNSDNETQEEVQEFVGKQKLNYPIGWTDSKVREEFIRITQMNGIPQSILVNREGKMIGIFTGGGPRVINSMKQTVEKAMNQ